MQLTDGRNCTRKVRIEWYPSIFAWKRLVRECEGLPFIRKDEMYTYISREPNEDLNLAEILRKLNLENIHVGAQVARQTHLTEHCFSQIIDWRRGTLFTPGNQDRLSLVAFNNLVHVEKKVPTRYFGRPERQPMDTLYVVGTCTSRIFKELGTKAAWDSSRLWDMMQKYRASRRWPYVIDEHKC